MRARPTSCQRSWLEALPAQRDPPLSMLLDSRRSTRAAKALALPHPSREPLSRLPSKYRIDRAGRLPCALQLGGRPPDRLLFARWLQQPGGDCVSSASGSE